MNDVWYSAGVGSSRILWVKLKSLLVKVCCYCALPDQRYDERKRFWRNLGTVLDRGSGVRLKGG